MTEFAKATAWIQRKGPALGAALTAGVDLLTSWRVTAAAQGKTVPALVSDDPSVQRAMADAANIAAIAGRHGVTIDDALEAARMVLALTTALL